MSVTRMAPIACIGAALAVGTALATDLAPGEQHPTHLMVLAQVALIVLWLCRGLQPISAAVVPIVGAALAVQPLLHRVSVAATSEALPREGTAAHVVVGVAPSAALQIGLPTIVLLGVTVLSCLSSMLARALRPSLPPRGGPVAEAPGRGPVINSAIATSPLRVCGWAIVAARRGPPVPSGS